MSTTVEEGVVEILRGMDKGIQQYGGQAMDLLLQTTYWRGVIFLTIGAIALLLTIGFIAHTSYRWSKESKDGVTWGGHEINYANMTFVLEIVAASASLITALVSLLNINNWLSVINPKVALANMLLDHLLSK